MSDVSKTGYGVDVSAARADELEKRLLAVVQSGETVLDIGCGAGGAAARLSGLGVQVTGVDVYDFVDDWSDGRGEFVLGDVRDLGSLVGERQFDYCLCNRTLHYLRYDDAAQVLSHLRGIVRQQLFISFSGLNSDLGKAGGAAARHEPIESRFATLAPAAQQTFGITAPLTLYTETEAIQLLSDTGWHVTWSRTTDFGNVLLQAESTI